MTQINISHSYKLGTKVGISTLLQNNSCTFSVPLGLNTQHMSLQLRAHLAIWGAHNSVITLCLKAWRLRLKNTPFLLCFNGYIQTRPYLLMQDTSNNRSSHSHLMLCSALPASWTAHDPLQVNSKYYKPVKWHISILRFQHILLIKQVIEEMMHYSRNSVSFYRKKASGIHIFFPAEEINKELKSV